MVKATNLGRPVSVVPTAIKRSSSTECAIETPCFWHSVRFPSSQSNPPASDLTIAPNYTNVYTSASHRTSSKKIPQVEGSLRQGARLSLGVLRNVDTREAAPRFRLPQRDDCDENFMCILMGLGHFDHLPARNGVLFSIVASVNRIHGSMSRKPPNGAKYNKRMSFTVFLGNLPVWVTADDVRSWLEAESLVADNIKVIRNPETQESKGFAFIDAPNSEEMQSIIRRFDRAPLEDRLLRANPAQPPRSKVIVGGRPALAGDRPTFQTQSPSQSRPPSHSGSSHSGPSQSGPSQSGPSQSNDMGQSTQPVQQRRERGGRKHAKRPGSDQGPQSAFAEELAKAL